ncbi:DNA polymerase III subunit delta' [Aerococcus kribbianus]|uniref:DNA polymerase III subunit delta n=1 Tax=Aerococcus kribbianus TaxID=2999064 RepID=A0A9X3JDV7_9LACT|nr:MULTISPECIES: DNA polymerase III subunit delta' [unclassified Aerococcus]MCZ0717906.1 DNA polymerase III subunit delta' [Aerococcus sp. YH-aer221]MCZ0726193.1 DNA polymerase III subunit delta' [Aerococcus sp. YH-aer222]
MAENTWLIKDKQAQLVTMIDQVLANDRLGHAYILEGMAGSGQEDMARYIAAALLCPNAEAPCGHCQICQRIQNGDYADFLTIAPEEQSLKVDQIRQLKQELTISPMEGDYKIFVINQAQTMTASAANSLLKFIEEPSLNMLIFLITPNRDALLPTIQSRCQVIQFPALNSQDFAELLMQAGINSQQAHLLAHLTNDRDQALALAEDEVFSQAVKVSAQWLPLILQKDPRAFTMVQTTIKGLSDDRRQHIQFLRLMAFMTRDLMHLALADAKQISDQYLEENLVFPHYQANYSKWLNHCQLADLIQGQHLLHKAQLMINHQVAVQAALEYLVLAWWQADTPS